MVLFLYLWKEVHRTIGQLVPNTSPSNIYHEFISFCFKSVYSFLHEQKDITEDWDSQSYQEKLS